MDTEDVPDDAPPTPAAPAPRRPRRFTRRHAVAALGLLAAVSVALAIVAGTQWGDIATAGGPKASPSATAEATDQPATPTSAPPADGGAGASGNPAPALTTGPPSATGSANAPPPPPPPPANDGNVTHLGVDETTGEGVDLESGQTVRTPSKDGQIDLSAERSGLALLNGAALAPWRARTPPTGAVDCGKAIFRTDTVPPTVLQPGTTYCVRTNAGRNGYLVIDGATVANNGFLDDVTFRYVLWG
jgi:hypothetical protein